MSIDARLNSHRLASTSGRAAPSARLPQTRQPCRRHHQDLWNTNRRGSAVCLVAAEGRTPPANVSGDGAHTSAHKLADHPSTSPLPSTQQQGSSHSPVANGVARARRAKHNTDSNRKPRRASAPSSAHAQRQQQTRPQPSVPDTPAPYLPVPAAALSPAYLTQHIKQAQTLPILAEFVIQFSEQFNNIHVTALLVRLSQLAQELKLQPLSARHKHDSNSDSDPYGLDHDDQDPYGYDSTPQDNGTGAQGSSKRGKAGGRGQGQRADQYRGSRDQTARVKRDQVRLRELTDRAVQLLQPRLVELDGFGVVTALYSLAKLGYRHPVNEDLLYLSSNHLADYDGQGLSNVMYAAALARVRPSPEWLSAFFRHSAPHLPRMGPQALSNILWGLATLGRAPGISTGSRDWEKGMYAAVVQTVRSPLCNTAALANICWALGKMDLFPGPHVTSVLAEAVSSQCTAMTEQGVANAVWGLAKLRAPLSTAWWDTFQRATYDRLPTMQPVALSSILYASALAGRRPDTRDTDPTRPTTTNPASTDYATDYPDTDMYSDMDDHTRLADKNGTESTGKGWGGDSAWDTQLQACVAAALPNSGAQVLTVVAYSFGRMATQPQAELLQILLSRSGSLMGAMTPQGLANLIWGLARMGVSVPPDWMQLYMEHSYNSLPLMNQQELTNVIWALSKLQVWPDLLWMTRFDQCSVELLHKYKPASLSLTLRSLALLSLQVQHLKLAPFQIADVLWAVAELRVPLPTSLTHKLINGITDQIALLPARTLAVALYALARLRAQVPQPLIELILAEVQYEIDSMSLDTLAGIAWALAALKYRPSGQLLGRIDQAALGHVRGMLGAGGGKGSDGVVVRGASGGSLVGDKEEASAGTRATLQATTQMEALCRLVAARGYLGGPPPPAALGEALLALLSRPEVLAAVTAPQLLLVVRGLASMGHVGTSGELLERLMPAAMQSRTTLFTGPAAS